MGSWKTGVLGGSLAGAVFGAGQSAYLLLTYELARKAIDTAMRADITLPGIGQSMLYLIFSGLFFGAFFGLLYGWRYDNIPGRSPALKGVAIGIFVFLINLSDVGFYSSIGTLFLAMFIIINLMLATIYGFLLSYIYYRRELY
ncbi:MAG: hypothetical protein ACP5T2_05765 [Thermoprotei archaeon]